MNKTLHIPFLRSYDQYSLTSTLSRRLDHEPRHPLDHSPWEEREDLPLVSFAIAHGGDALFLKYYVAENTMRATYSRVNDPVYNDSCTEFFIALQGEECHYNFEFNALGTAIAGFGKGRQRELLPNISVEAIRHSGKFHTSASYPPGRHFNWELCLMIPIEAFTHHAINTLAGLSCSGNFYKCGEMLPEPHYLCWNRVTSSQPDFHRIQDFGELHFMS